MNEWYTRQEVANVLGISKATVYQYAKQKKIIKIADPHRLFREARYKREEVDILAEERKRNLPTGLRPSELAKQLRVPVSKIYAIIKEHKLPVEEIMLGDEAKGYSISIELAERIKQEIIRVTPIRGSRVEFYESKHDIAIFQRFITPNGQNIRVLRNDQQDWGFYLQSRSWIGYEEAIQIYQYRPAYQIHQHSIRAKGYTDFSLPKDLDETFELLDFIYEVWGIENIRLREHGTSIELSIKSGTTELPRPLPETITIDLIASFVVAGEIVQNGNFFVLISGSKSTTVELPVSLMDRVQIECKEDNISFSKFVELALLDKIQSEK